MNKIKVPPCIKNAAGAPYKNQQKTKAKVLCKRIRNTKYALSTLYFEHYCIEYMTISPLSSL